VIGSPAGDPPRPASGGPRAGLVLLRKPTGVTSFQALYPLKSACGSGKVGHAGTLDRFASGLLVVLAGSYSRIASYVQRGEKRYRGLVAFGQETETLDPEGRVIAEAPIPSRGALEAALSAFRGKISQRPPAYSAVHVGGKRAYEIARRGDEPVMRERTVEIYSLELLSYEGGEALLDVSCSSGTYIRSLARDIALACGSRAHLTALERLSIGPYGLEEAVSPEGFDPRRDLRPFSPEDAVALGLGAFELRMEEDARRFAMGGRIPRGAFSPLGGRQVPGGESAVFAAGRFLGIADIQPEGPRYLAVMPVEGGGGE